jgi:hypothetical protein
MHRALRDRHFSPVPLFAGVASAVLIVGTLVGQGGHAKGDSDIDMSGMSMSMPGMSMPGMDMGNGSGDASSGTDSSGGMDMNMPGMPQMAATPDGGGAATPTTVSLKPGASKDAGGMTVKLVKISHGAATVQMGKDTATLRQGAKKKFGDGMTVQAVKVKPNSATLKVSPPA